uniref:Uncharacterized protein n=1 Tax=Entomoneis paludosa TaxID=265537 RepID=A0A7S2VF68_9STRA|mmetsp:Transcript_16084/g.33286  ORF Transcript_16084/g.33286 Transcript_16084/m.33286 type:complete len:360 (+) Transcript_16084:172-1251(+)
MEWTKNTGSAATNSTTMSPPKQSTAASWQDKLITSQDGMYFHKILAVLCLLSYSWRLMFMVLSNSSDMGFATYPSWTIPTILLHGALNVSSLQFDIPRQRIATGYRIWPEYRWHSLIFTGRALAIMLLYHLEQIHQLPPMPVCNILIVLMAAGLADVASWSVGAKYHSKSIRELAVPAWVKFFFSTMQFFGTIGLLLGFPRRRFTIPFWHVIVVQGNAFLMTVRRKNLAPHNSLLLVYGIGLCLGFTATMMELILVPNEDFSSSLTVDMRPFLVATTIACSVAFLRFGGLAGLLSSSPLGDFFQSKYFLWTNAGLLWIFFWKPRLIQNHDEPWLMLSTVSSVVALGVLGWIRCTSIAQP